MLSVWFSFSKFSAKFKEFLTLTLRTKWGHNYYFIYKTTVRPILCPITDFSYNMRYLFAYFASEYYTKNIKTWPPHPHKLLEFVHRRFSKNFCFPQCVKFCKFFLNCRLINSKYLWEPKGIMYFIIFRTLLYYNSELIRFLDTIVKIIIKKL